MIKLKMKNSLYNHVDTSSVYWLYDLDSHIKNGYNFNVEKDCVASLLHTLSSHLNFWFLESKENTSELALRTSKSLRLLDLCKKLKVDDIFYPELLIYHFKGKSFSLEKDTYVGKNPFQRNGNYYLKINNFNDHMLILDKKKILTYGELDIYDDYETDKPITEIILDSSTVWFFMKPRYEKALKNHLIKSINEINKIYTINGIQEIKMK